MHSIYNNIIQLLFFSISRSFEGYMVTFLLRVPILPEDTAILMILR